MREKRVKNKGRIYIAFRENIKNLEGPCDGQRDRNGYIRTLDMVVLQVIIFIL